VSSEVQKVPRQTYGTSATHLYMGSKTGRRQRSEGCNNGAVSCKSWWAIKSRKGRDRRTAPVRLISTIAAYEWAEARERGVELFATALRLASRGLDGTYSLLTTHYYTALQQPSRCSRTGSAGCLWVAAAVGGWPQKTSEDQRADTTPMIATAP
jgi:hypothetical protein